MFLLELIVKIFKPIPDDSSAKNMILISTEKTPEFILLVFFFINWCIGNASTEVQCLDYLVSTTLVQLRAGQGAQLR